MKTQENGGLGVERMTSRALRSLETQWDLQVCGSPCSDANTLANILTSTWMESKSVLQAQKATSWAQRFHQGSSNSDEKLLLRHTVMEGCVKFQQLLLPNGSLGRRAPIF